MTANFEYGFTDSIFVEHTRTERFDKKASPDPSKGGGFGNSVQSNFADYD